MFCRFGRTRGDWRQGLLRREAPCEGGHGSVTELMCVLFKIFVFYEARELFSLSSEDWLTALQL